MFTVGFPFFVLGCNNYAHYSDSGITVSRYFQLNETYSAYEDIQEVSIYIHHNNKGKVNVICYEIRLSDGKRFDINDGAYRIVGKSTLEIHKLLEKRATCAPNITPLNDADLEYLKTLDREKAEAIRYIFEGFHV